MPYGSEVANFLVSASTSFKQGGSTGAQTPIWMNKFPGRSSNTAIAIFESGGPAPLYTHSGLSLERPTVQIISRSTSYATARQNADFIFRTLAGVTNAGVSKTTSTGETSYLTITPLQSPTDMGQDAEERSMVTCNYMAEKEMS
jgi:hypothetical protein